MKTKPTGWKPSAYLQVGLQTLVAKREPNEVIVVHHFTDTPEKLQLEVERRSVTLGLKFERIIIT